MRLGIRLFFGFFLITGLAGFFVMRVFVSEVKPSVRQVMEDIMVDTANILAELATEDVVAGRIADGRFSEHVNQYARRTVDARIWGMNKQTLDFRIYVTDTNGKVLFDSIQVADGQDYSQWRDVALTLRGQYGARSTRDVAEDQLSTVMYVAAPISHEGKVVGVLTVAKPNATVQAFIDRAERKILVSGFWLLGLSALVGVVVTVWVVWSIRQLRRYANDVEAGKKVAIPRVAGELGELARAMDAMRQRVERREYMEAYVRALTHELKSPLAAIRGAGELLQEDLPAADRQTFADEVLLQTTRLQALVDRMLELSKLEQRHQPMAPERVVLSDFLQKFVANAKACASFSSVEMEVQFDASVVLVEPELLTLALNNLLGNAAAFAPLGGHVLLQVAQGVLAVQDYGPGVPDYALPKLGTRFFSTVRPDGVTKGSGLGLAIVRQIVVLHGGSMEIHNTNPGLRVELIFPASH